jgi:hypothetical protein
MKSSSILAAGAAALLSLAAPAHADLVLHFTGSTAFRVAAVNSIVNVLGGSANVKSAYKTGAGITGRGNASQCVIQGTHASFGTVTVKCAWSGSAGGVKTVVQNIDTLNGWMSVSNLPATTGTDQGVAAPDYTLDFTGAGESNQADIAFSDAKQVTTGFTSASLSETRVGVIPFEWVVGNQSAPTDVTPTPPTGSAITNMTPLLAQAVLSGGAPLSQFTGVPGDVAVPVYALGRDADSGTRISCLAETGVGVFGSVQHVQIATTGGAAGTAGSKISSFFLWPASTLLGVAYPIGNGGYAGGGGVATALATPGSTTADTITGVPADQQVLFGAGQLVGYLGRSDARTATATNVIANNNAHRLTFNGVKFWNDPIAANGAPASYLDSLIQEGVYQCWEYEWMSYRSTFGTTNANGKSFADLVATRIQTTDGTASGILLTTMNVTKAVEGGVITHL